MGILLTLLPALLPIFEKVLSSLIPDPAARQKAIQDILGQLQQADLSQLEVNKVEAASSSIFVAGWRPFLGWVCGGAFAWQFVIAPLVMWGGFVIGHPLPKPPTLDAGIWELVFGMLGLGAMRSWEKIKGAAT
jgi:hypothetical protein